MIKCILLMFATMLFPSGAYAEEPEYIVIESDYAGTVLLDVETGTRYLRTDTGLYELEEG